MSSLPSSESIDANFLDLTDNNGDGKNGVSSGNAAVAIKSEIDKHEDDISPRSKRKSFVEARRDMVGSATTIAAEAAETPATALASSMTDPADAMESIEGKTNVVNVTKVTEYEAGTDGSSTVTSGTVYRKKNAERSPRLSIKYTSPSSVPAPDGKEGQLTVAEMVAEAEEKALSAQRSEKMKKQKKREKSIESSSFVSSSDNNGTEHEHTREHSSNAKSKQQQQQQQQGRIPRRRSSEKLRGLRGALLAEGETLLQQGEGQGGEDKELRAMEMPYAPLVSMDDTNSDSEISTASTAVGAGEGKGMAAAVSSVGRHSAGSQLRPPRGRNSGIHHNQQQQQQQQREKQGQQQRLEQDEGHKGKGIFLPEIKSRQSTYGSDLDSESEQSTFAGIGAAGAERGSGGGGLISPNPKGKKKRPLYLRMIARAKKKVYMEEKSKHEQYLKFKETKAKNNPSREEIREHMARHDERMEQLKQRQQAELLQVQAAKKEQAAREHKERMMAEIGHQQQQQPLPPLGEAPLSNQRRNRLLQSPPAVHGGEGVSDDKLAAGNSESASVRNAGGGGGRGGKGANSGHAQHSHSAAGSSSSSSSGASMNAAHSRVGLGKLDAIEVMLEEKRMERLRRQNEVARKNRELQQKKLGLHVQQGKGNGDGDGDHNSPSVAASASVSAAVASATAKGARDMWEKSNIAAAAAAGTLSEGQGKEEREGSEDIRRQRPQQKQQLAIVVSPKSSHDANDDAMSVNSVNSALSSNNRLNLPPHSKKGSSNNSKNNNNNNNNNKNNTSSSSEPFQVVVEGSSSAVISPRTKYAKRLTRASKHQPLNDEDPEAQLVLPPALAGIRSGKGEANGGSGGHRSAGGGGSVSVGGDRNGESNSAFSSASSDDMRHDNNNSNSSNANPAYAAACRRPYMRVIDQGLNIRNAGIAKEFDRQSSSHLYNKMAAASAKEEDSTEEMFGKVDGELLRRRGCSEAVQEMIGRAIVTGQPHDLATLCGDDWIQRMLLV